jgi:hypothetical protein
MLHILPTELSLFVLSYLPLRCLCALPTLSRQWLNFFSENQTTIFHNAAFHHQYVQPGDSLSPTGDWKDFCKSKSTPRSTLPGLFRETRLLAPDPRHCERGSDLR